MRAVGEAHSKGGNSGLDGIGINGGELKGAAYIRGANIQFGGEPGPGSAVIRAVPVDLVLDRAHSDGGTT